MRTLIGIALLLGLGFAQGICPSFRSIRADVFAKGTNGKPAVLPGARIVLRGPITKETESDTQEALAIDGLHPETYEIEANASHSFAALAVEVSAGASSNIPDEMNVAAVTSAMSTQLTQLKAMDCAFSRKVHHA